MRKKQSNGGPQDRLLPRFSLAVFDRPRLAAILWLCVTIFGILSYTTFMKRQGFPSINIPYSVASGSYLVSNAQKVDADVAKPVSDVALKDSRVKTVQAQSQANFYTVAIQYKEGTDARKAGKELQQKIADAHLLPSQANIKIETPKFGFTERGDDAVISVYAKQKGSTPQVLKAEADKLTTAISQRNLSTVSSVSTIDPFVTGINPLTGQTMVSQKTFDRYGVRKDGQNTFYDSVAVGVSQKSGTDVIELDGQLQKSVADYNAAHPDSGFVATVSAGYAHSIKDQISELQRALLEGLVAVLVIGSIVIAVRASLITVLAMLTVLAAAVGALFVFGYTLNTITLFALILCLGLIVDDTIIMTEAIDAQRRRHTDPRETVEVATRKISRAMVAATLTAVMSFAPLLFVSGILGGFIRAIPVTVIASLLISLCVALVFIPFFARFLLLGKKQMGTKNVHEPAAGIEAKIARFIGRPMLWARHSRKKLFGVGLTAVFIGLAFVMAGGYLFQKVTFNIFPPSKDTNGLTMAMTFAPGTTIGQAEQLADRADKIAVDTLGRNVTQASYYANANEQTATLTIDLISYKDRKERAPELQKELQAKLNNFDGAKVKVNLQDVGPPPSAFTVRVQTDDRQAALRLTKDLNAFLYNRKLTRVSGTTARVTETNISNPGAYTRNDGKLYMSVTANFDATDTTTLVDLAKKAVQKEFTAEKLRSYGLSSEALQYDFGQEGDNQDSFKTLAMAFPILLVAIYVLLAVQFRSLAQPLLIFMALPFSLFGITLGLYLSNNAFSFFAMLGFFALIGLSIKNTILLTDYANQLRRTGMPAVDAAVGALSERFRPLISTSLTAVVSLIPLAISSPFWEGLAVVLISGLLSSTFLVIVVFPYYYLGAEFIRLRVSRRACLLTIAAIVALIVIVKAVA